jgi:hypothetical protein
MVIAEAAGEDHTGSEPVTPVKTCPVVPAAVTPKALVPSPRRTPCAVNVCAPDPPSGTVTGIVSEIVPVVVIGFGTPVSPVPTVMLVTVPDPGPEVDINLVICDTLVSLVVQAILCRQVH